MKNVMFADVPVGGKFFYQGSEYLKTKNYQSGKLGSVNVETGVSWSDCSHWCVTICDTQGLRDTCPSSKVQVILTYAYNDDPAIFTMTDEQFNLFKILYENDFLGEDVSYTVINDDIAHFDATET